MEDLSSIVAKFNTQGTITKVRPLGAGLINGTYKVNIQEADAPDCILQRINHAIFQNVEMFQSSIAAVAGHIRKKLTEVGEADIDYKVLSFLATEGGRTYWSDGESCWRVMVFIPRTRTYETVSPEYSNYAEEAFGNFQAMLADIPGTLGKTTPGFHNMEFRLKQLCDAVAANAAGQVVKIQYYLDEIEKHAGEMCGAERLFRGGRLLKRVYHYDTKVNSTMFDEDGKVLCVIDLDAVMPSFIFSDYGDFLHTGANTGDEDNKDLNRVNFNMKMFKAFTREYLKGAKSFLTPVEIEDLPYTTTLFPYIRCVRFLADYISGDIYYKVKYPEHNLVRTKTQFKLLQSVEEHTPEMVAFTNECLVNE